MKKPKSRRTNLLFGRDEERARLYASLTPTERVRWVERHWRVAAELKARAALLKTGRRPQS